MEQNPEELDDAIEGSGRRRKILIWLIVACVVAAVIGIPALLLRQTEPTAATEPTTIEQLQTDLDSVELTVAGHTEDIADLETAGCVCPDYATDITNVRNSVTVLQAEWDAIIIPSIPPDLSANVSEITTGFANLGDDVATLEAYYVALQAEVDGIVVTDWTSTIAVIQSGISSLQSQIALLPTSLPPHAEITNIDGGFIDLLVHGDGDYVVILTLYGTDLPMASVSMNPWIDYCYVGDMYATNSSLVVGIEPYSYTGWHDGDIIKLLVDNFGSISYATAAVGGEA